MSRAATPDPARRSACPVCGAPAAPAARPFCGQGCRDRDLLRWLSDGHRLPGPPADGENEAEVGAGATAGLDSSPDARL